MKTIRIRKGGGRGEGRPFAFFAAGALVVLAAVFVVGLQVGRYIEKREGDANASRGPSPGTTERQDAAESIRTELGAFSTEAEALKSVPPPGEGGGPETAPVSGLTFPSTLEREKPAPVPLAGKTSVKSAKPLPARDGEPSQAHFVQAGVFRDRTAAAGLADRIRKAGYPAAVRPGAGKKGNLYRVVAGPFAGREAALQALRKLKTDLKISGIVTRG